MWISFGVKNREDGFCFTQKKKWTGREKKIERWVSFGFLQVIRISD
jgi:hypothetical protein